MLSTKQIGDITEIECILALKKKGIIVSIPYGEDSPYDLVAEINGKLSKIQCKTSSIEGNGSFKFSCKVSHTNTKETVTKNYLGKIDYFMTTFNGNAYLIPIQDCGVRSKTLRYVESSNGQQKGISYADDYLLDNIIKC